MTEKEIIRDYEAKVLSGEIPDLILCRTVLSAFNRLQTKEKEQRVEIEQLQQNLKEAHIDIGEHMAENDRLKKLLDDKCDKCISRDKSDAMRELAREIINDILPKYLYGRETQALQIGFAISEKVNELMRKR